MIYIKKLIKAIKETLENEGKARALASLRAMDAATLEASGFSLEALDEGISAWPWRQPEQPNVDQAAVAELDLDAHPVNESEHKQAA